MSQTYRVAIIGRTGKGNYGHGLDTAWVDHPGTEIVAVADEDEKGRVAAQKRLKCANAYADYREMLKKERPHFVSVADRWLDLHRDMVLACAEVGASIFLEKPMCRTLAEADEMIAACEKHHVKCAMAHQTRYSPSVAKAKELVAAGQLGELMELRGRGKEDQRGGGQDMMVLGTHIFDLMRYFAGDAKWCFSRISIENRPAVIPGDVRMGGEAMGPVLGDRITSMYGFDGGLVGHFATQKATAGVGSRFGLFLCGSKGIMHLVTGSLPAIYYLDEPSWMSSGKTSKPWQTVSSQGIGVPETATSKGAFELGNSRIVADLIASVEKDRQPLGSIYDGRAALEMILAAYESHKLGKAVDLPLKNRQHPLV